jgi:hypothetical protein
MTSDPSDPFNVLREWKPGDTREVREAALRQARIEDRYDSYAQTYRFDGRLWKIRGQMSLASGETVYTLVCVEE